MHQAAAGFSIPISNIDRLITYANTRLKDINFNEGFYEVDFVVNSHTTYLKDLIINLDSHKELFGQGNPEVKIAIESINLNPNDIQVLGKGDTFKFIIDGITYIKFRSAELAEELKSKTGKFNITVIGKPNVNVYMGTSTPQIMIEEMEVKDSSIYDF